MRTNPTIRDISRHAQVSTATVSRVLAGSPKVKPETRRRVLEVIAEFGYEPNHIARSLSVRRTQTIGLVLEAIVNPFFVEVAGAIETEMTTAGFTMMTMSTNWDSAKELAAIRTMLRNRVDGVLLTPIAVDSESVQLLRKWRLPFVLLNINARSDRLASVCTDDYRGGRLAAQALMESNAVSVVSLQGFPHQSTFSRIEGFKAAVDAASKDRELRFRNIVDVRTFEEGYRAAASLASLDLPSEGTLGIFATNDDVALGVLASLFDHGISVPQQVAVVGYDDIPMAQRFQIPLTTIAQPTREIGRLAARELIEQLQHPDRAPKSYILLPRLVQRASTMPVRFPNSIPTTGERIE